MAWLRLGDTAATYPKLLECGEHPDADDQTVNLVFGWFLRIAAEAARHPHATDYIVKMGTARLIGGGRAMTEVLIGFAQFAGLLDVVEVDGRPHLRLLNDPEFVHIKTGDVLAFEKQRRQDNGKPDITTLIRMRDGDACRYCGRVVNFAARTGKLAGTYDHRPPGKPADAETSVVACSSCNASRNDLPLELADAQRPLLPAPLVPYYSRETRKWLNGHAALLAANGLNPPPLADDAFQNLTPGTVLQHPDPAPDGVRPGDARPADPAPNGVRPAANLPAPDRRLAGPGGTRQDASVQATGSPGRDGTGRDGTGRDGTARDGTLAPLGEGAALSPPPDSPAVPPAQPDRPARRRRGRRGGTRNRRTGGTNA